jgi:hypothetical protein
MAEREQELLARFFGPEGLTAHEAGHTQVADVEVQGQGAAAQRPEHHQVDGHWTPDHLLEEPLPQEHGAVR